MWETTLLTILAAVLKSIFEDAITGKLNVAPTPVIDAQDDPVITNEVQNAVTQWDRTTHTYHK